MADPRNNPQQGNQSTSETERENERDRQATQNPRQGNQSDEGIQPDRSTGTGDRQEEGQSENIETGETTTRRGEENI